LSEEKPLYVGRFYNYDNIKELNNNEDLIQNVALKFNDMERALNTWKLLSDVEYHIPGAVNGMVAPAGNPSLILLTTWFEIELITAALSAKQGSILKNLVDTKANSTGDNSIAFNVAMCLW
jgi:hypothetical protein